MADSPFIGETYPLASRPTSVQRTVNMMPVAVEPGNERSNWVFKDVPGLVLVDRTIVPPPPSAYWLLNSHVTTGSPYPDTLPWVLSDGDRTAYVPDPSGTGVEHFYQGSIVSNLPQSSGKRYFEITISGATTWAYSISDSTFTYGLVNSLVEAASIGALTALGSAGTWAYGPDAADLSGRYAGDDGAGGITTSYTLPAYASGTVLMFAVDIDARKLWLGVDGVWVTGNPSTNTTPIATNMPSPPFNPAFAVQRALTAATLGSNPTQFHYTMPTGFTYWAAA